MRSLNIDYSQINEDYLKFKLPRYNELPAIELYIDQVISYVEGVVSPILCPAENEKILTTAMVNNYVKQKVLGPSDKKKYSKDHVAYLIVLCLLKQIYSIQDISRLITMQLEISSTERAYDYFCEQMELALYATFTATEYVFDDRMSSINERHLVRNSVIAFVNKLHVQVLLKYLEDLEEKQVLP